MTQANKYHCYSKASKSEHKSLFMKHASLRALIDLALLRRILVNNDIDIPHRLHASAYKILGKKKSFGRISTNGIQLTETTCSSDSVASVNSLTLSHYVEQLLDTVHLVGCSRLQAVVAFVGSVQIQRGKKW